MTSTKNDSSDKRVFSLDVLRGIAIALVMVRHAPMFRPESGGGEIAESLFEVLHRIGWVGVDLFFVLSGFLIAGLLIGELQETGGLQIGRFWMRRGFKIWPSYYICYGGMVALWCVRDIWRGDRQQLSSNLRDAAINCAFLQNYVDCTPWPHSWSLAVEEHFYLVLPILISVIVWQSRRRSWSSGQLRTIVLVAFAFVAISALALRGWNDFNGRSWHLNYYSSHLRADGLAFGVMLSLAYRYAPSLCLRVKTMRWPIVSFALGALCVPYFYTKADSWQCTTVGFTLLYVGFGGLVLLAAMLPTAGRDWRFGASIPVRFLGWLGVYSYTVYLAHSVISGIPGMASGRDYLLEALSGAGVGDVVIRWSDRLLFWTLSIGVGVALSHVVERPCLRLRSKWFPRPQRSASFNLSQGETPALASDKLEALTSDVMSGRGDAVVSK